MWSPNGWGKNQAQDILITSLQVSELLFAIFLYGGFLNFYSQVLLISESLFLDLSLPSWCGDFLNRRWGGFEVCYFSVIFSCCISSDGFKQPHIILPVSSTALSINFVWEEFSYTEVAYFTAKMLRAAADLRRTSGSAQHDVQISFLTVLFFA